MSVKIQRGFTDQVADEDLFNIGHYITGLTKYIETCNTPMTVSIQGSWGTGKTGKHEGRKHNEEPDEKKLHRSWRSSRYGCRLGWLLFGQRQRVLCFRIRQQRLRVCIRQQRERVCSRFRRRNALRDRRRSRHLLRARHHHGPERWR